MVLRLYAPLQPWFDKSWKPGDFDGSIECSTHGGRFNGGYMKPVLVIAALLGFPACSQRLSSTKAWDLFCCPGCREYC